MTAGIRLNFSEDPSAQPDVCAGVCSTLAANGNNQVSVCGGRCQLGGAVGCGFDLTASAAVDAFCLYGPTNADVGDLGLCGQLCDCNGDCRDAAFICRADSTLQSVTGRAGYCTAPNNGGGGTDKGIACP